MRGSMWTGKYRCGVQRRSKRLGLGEAGSVQGATTGQVGGAQATVLQDRSAARLLESKQLDRTRAS